MDEKRVREIVEEAIRPLRDELQRLLPEITMIKVEIEEMKTDIAVLKTDMVEVKNNQEKMMDVLDSLLEYARNRDQTDRGTHSRVNQHDKRITRLESGMVTV